MRKKQEAIDDLNYYKIELDTTPATEHDYLGRLIPPKIELKTYYFPKDWKPVLGEFNQPKCYHFNHQHSLKEGKYEIWWHDVFVWCQDKAWADKFIEANNIDMSKSARYSKDTTNSGWMVDYI